MTNSGAAVKLTDWHTNNKNSDTSNTNNQNSDTSKIQLKAFVSREEARAYGPVVLLTDIPTTSVFFEVIQRVLSSSSLSGQDERTVIHRFSQGGRYLGSKPPPWNQTFFCCFYKRNQCQENYNKTKLLNKN